jgi:hypothetical protein
MAVYIDTDYVDALCGGSSKRQAFFDDGSGYDGDAFDQAVLTASERVKAAGLAAGYSLGDTTTSELVKEATFGQFLVIMYGRQERTPTYQFRSYIDLCEAIRSGLVPIPGATPDTTDAVGGVEFTSSDANDSTGIGTGDTRVPVFKTLRNYW